jgi:CheY-like chemotaxis protein/two-component sensor histidine kinase
MAAIGILAAGVVHEINNPLAAVLANLQLVLQDLATLPAFSERAHAEMLDGIREGVADAESASNRMRRIVSDLRIFSRAEKRGVGPVDVEEVLESTLRMATSETHHRARLVRNYGEIPPVVATETRLGQVFLNLVVNAAHAIRAGNAKENEIRVSTSVGTDGQVLIEIADSGPGIPPELVDRIFTPFFTTKVPGVGTGLGLSISQRIVEELGGTLAARNAPGSGAIFTISLPPAPAGAEVAKLRPPAAEHASTRRGRVLVIDDEAMIGRAIERSLSREHDVVVAESGDLALRRFRAGERFDVILCDLMMPHVTGMDLYDALVELDRKQADCIVFMTGGAFTERSREFVAKVTNLRIEKPFELTRLRELVNERIG